MAFACVVLTSISLKVSATANKSLVDEEWFHGVLPREEVVRLLTLDGDFLVRETTRNDECQTVLSVCWGGHKHFIVQTTAEVSVCVILIFLKRLQTLKATYNF